MPLVTYPDSEDEDNSEPSKKHTQPTPTHISATLPPLPPKFHSVYTTPARPSTVDDPSLHGGRRRQIPHVEGNWNVHIYLEWLPSRNELENLRDFVTKATATAGRDLRERSSGKESAVHSFLESPLGAQLPLHVSLSVPLVLRAEQKEDFEERLAKEIRQSAVGPFEIRVCGVGWVSNFDGSRFFLILRLDKPEGDELNRLLKVCNACARRFGMGELYGIGDQTGKFHVSIAWSLGRNVMGEGIEEGSVEIDGKGLERLKIGFDTMKLKMGKVVRDVVLAGDKE